MAKTFYFFQEMFTKLPISDVLPKIFVKMTQKIQILLHILHKSVSHTPANYAYIVCDLSARGSLRLQDRSRLGAHGCLRQQSRSQN